MAFRISFYIFLVSTLLSCDSLRKQVTPKSIAAEPEKLVVSCFISPQDTVLSARVSRSLPWMGTGNTTTTDVANATVILSDGSKSIQLRGRVAQEINGEPYTLYQVNASAFSIVAGATYTLRVSDPDGRTVTGSCTVPSIVNLKAVTLDSLAYADGNQRLMSYFVRMRWHDPAGQVNYYRINGNNAYKFTNTAATNNSDLLQSGRGNLYFQGSSLLTDEGYDGQEIISMRANLVTPSFVMDGQLKPSQPTGILNAYLLSVDENYYRYHDAIERQIQADGNPFSEPVLIPTNIQGGLGCFGAYNRSTLTINLH